MADRDEWCDIASEIADDVFGDAVKDFLRQATDSGLGIMHAQVAATQELLGWAASANGAPSKEKFLEHAAIAYDRAQEEIVMCEKEGEAIH